MSNEKNCRGCRFLRPPSPDKDGKTRWRKGQTYLCQYVVPWPPLPDSIRHGSWNSVLPRPSWVNAEDGANCPVWESKE